MINSKLEKIKEIAYRINANKDTLEELNEIYIKAFSPKGFKGSTSYNDYDTIPGGNKEMGIIDYSIEKRRLEILIEIDERIIQSLREEIEVEERLRLMDNNYDRIKFLRKVIRKTQKQTAKILDINIRHVQRLEKRIKETL